MVTIGGHPVLIDLLSLFIYLVPFSHLISWICLVSIVLHFTMDENGSDDHNSKEIISYCLTQQQKDAIKELFASEQWNYKEVSKDHEQTENNDNNFDLDNIEPEYVIKQCDNAEECPRCLCKPCITDEERKQGWWPSKPSKTAQLNSVSRKRCYKSFWTMLVYRKVCRDERE